MRQFRGGGGEPSLSLIRFGGLIYRERGSEGGGGGGGVEGFDGVALRALTFKGRPLKGPTNHNM